MRVIGIVLVILVGAMAYIRLAPVKFVAREFPSVVGEYPETGGFTAVVALSDRVNLASVEAAMLALPRTRKIKSDLPTFVTRSRVFGFPDVTVLMVQDGTLVLSGHLVYGGSDFGVNRARISQVLASL